MKYVVTLFLFIQFSHQKVQPSDLDTLLENNIKIIDVRTAEEFSEGALPNAENVSVNSLSFLTEIQHYQKDQAVLVYCKRGSRSARAVVIMKTLGFEQIYELEGGYIAWKEEQ